MDVCTPPFEWPDTLESAATLVRAMKKPPFWGKRAAEGLYAASLAHLEQVRRSCRHAKPGPKSVPLRTRIAEGLAIAPRNTEHFSQKEGDELGLVGPV